jgi:hypothetical protein
MSASKIWILLLPRSATNSRPWESKASPWGWLNSPGPAAVFGQEVAVPVELDDARAGGGSGGVPLGHEDLAGRVGDDVVGLVERGPVHGLPWLVAAGLAQRHEQLALGAELEDLVAQQLRRPGRVGGPPAPRQVVLPVGHPDVPLAVHVDAVGEGHQPLAEAGEQPSGGVELEDHV